METNDVDKLRVVEHRDRENRWIEKQHEEQTRPSDKVDGKVAMNEPNDEIDDHDEDMREEPMTRDPLDSTDSWKEADEDQDVCDQKSNND